MLFSITDHSMDPGEKLKCLLFARNEHALPQIHDVGDIIRIHRLKVSSTPVIDVSHPL